MRAYRRTDYGAAGLVVRVGRRSPEADGLLGGRTGGFVTACNPRSRRMPPGWNERRNRQLAARLRTLPHWAGWGVGRAWREAHFLVAADPRRLLVLARQFRQNAIVALARGQAARLLWCDAAAQRAIEIASKAITQPAGRAATKPASRNGRPAP